MKIFYDRRQSVEKNDSFSPSAGKAALVVDSWKKLDVPIEIEGFDPVTTEMIAQVHDRQYVEDVLSCRIANGFGNRSTEIAKALPWVCGSMVASALYSYREKKPSFSVTSGAHHAHHDSGGNFCTFNFLVLAAVEAKKVGAKRIGIIDVDNHYGDGTDDIIKRLRLDFIKHYSFGAEGIISKTAKAWLEKLPETLFTFEGCDLVIYNAGVDSHLEDSLGGVLSTEQLQLRDRRVFETMKALGIPVCSSLAGGYRKDKAGTITPVLRLHDNTLIECDEVFGWGSRTVNR